MLCRGHFQNRKRHFQILSLAQTPLGRAWQTFPPFSSQLFPGAFANQFSTKGKQENQRSGFKNRDVKQGPVSLICNTSIWEAEAGGLLWVWDQLELQVCFKKQNKNEQRKRRTMMSWCQWLLDDSSFLYSNCINKLNFLEQPCGEVTSGSHRNGHCLLFRRGFAWFPSWLHMLFSWMVSPCLLLKNVHWHADAFSALSILTRCNSSSNVTHGLLHTLMSQSADTGRLHLRNILSFTSVSLRLYWEKC